MVNCMVKKTQFHWARKKHLVKIVKNTKLKINNNLDE